MKNILFLVLLTLVFCQTESTNNKERVSKRKEYYKILEDCILKEEISTDLQKKIEENKEDDLRSIIEYVYSPSNRYPGDKDAIKKCRKEFFEKMRERYRKRFEDRNHPTGPISDENVKSNSPI